MCGRSTFCMLCETFCHVEDNILSETCTCACRVDRAKEAIIIACHPRINLFIFLFSWFQCQHVFTLLLLRNTLCIVNICVRMRAQKAIFIQLLFWHLQVISYAYTVVGCLLHNTRSTFIITLCFRFIAETCVIFVSEYSAIYIEHKRKEFLWYFETLCSRNLDCWTMSSTTYFFHYFISIIIAKQLKMVFPPLVLMAGNHLFWFIHL